MVAALHGAGIEVILDVVLNHTAESDVSGPTLSLRGLDNASYYRLDPADRVATGLDRQRQHARPGEPRVLQLAMDALRHWAVHSASTASASISRPCSGATGGRRFAADAPLLQALRQDPVLGRLKLIAEPWDIGPDGYRLGGFPASVRRVERPLPRRGAPLLARRRGDRAGARRTAAGLGRPVRAAPAGGRRRASISSPAMTASRWPTSSPTRSATTRPTAKATATATTTISAPTTASRAPSDDPSDPAALRQRQRRNLLATLLLAQGTPMLLMGDELGRSQARQQQRLLPGQRTELVRLGFKRGRPGAAGICRPPGCLAAGSSDAPTDAIPAWPATQQPWRARRHLVGAHRPGDGRRRLARQANRSFGLRLTDDSASLLLLANAGQQPQRLSCPPPAPAGACCSTRRSRPA